MVAGYEDHDGKELCEELNVSRVAVRQASEQLVAIGLLKKIQGAGTFVRNMDESGYISSIMPMLLVNEKDMLSILEFRIAFESGNVKMFMKHCDQKDLEQLEFYLEEMQKNIDDIEKFHWADFKFHETIAKGTKNPFVAKISEIMFEVLESHQAVLYQRVGPGIGLDYHQDILKAIKKGDQELASFLMQRHVEYTVEKYTESLEAEV